MLDKISTIATHMLMSDVRLRSYLPPLHFHGDFGSRRVIDFCLAQGFNAILKHKLFQDIFVRFFFGQR